MFFFTHPTSQHGGEGVKRVLLLFQPLSHIMERIAIFGLLALGGMAGIYRGSMENVSLCTYTGWLLHMILVYSDKGQ